MSATARIDLDAFRHNVRTLVALVAPSRVMLAVKANAYGHGMVAISEAALEAGATSLAVLEIPAAIRLREAGVTAPLFAWLHGQHTNFSLASQFDIDLGISALWQLESLTRAAPESAVRIHLKIDTGLHRNGASPGDWPELVSAAIAAATTGFVQLEGVWSHLADSSPDDDAVALERLHEAIAIAERLGARFNSVHLAASSAGIRMPEARLDLVRFGIAAYGISPFENTDARGLGLIPVMTLQTSVIDLNLSRSQATIAAGFGDGLAAARFPATPSTPAEVQIRGRRHKVVSIGVDRAVVEFTGPGEFDLQVGDEVIVFGSGDTGEPTARDWATWSGTIGDEIVTQISDRVPRQIVGR